MRAPGGVHRVAHEGVEARRVSLRGGERLVVALLGEQQLDLAVQPVAGAIVLAAGVDAVLEHRPRTLKVPALAQPADRKASQ